MMMTGGKKTVPSGNVLISISDIACLRAMTSIDILKPLQPPWCESKLRLRLLVRSAAQLRCVVNGIRATGLNCRFLTYVEWCRRPDKIGKCRQPDSQSGGIVVDDVVHARAYFQGRNRWEEKVSVRYWNAIQIALRETFPKQIGRGSG